ncbi:unnamed protein product [Adineta steineri]|uniref:Uncharacterized protein n=1 Tax=Adineta steineri TaxID=433720 RepID=A0A814A2W0_9BILA|nr:unnamed protein product [Adineta steineri]CAF1148612.1 unnamed protein product [Adineta steineri]
MQREYKTTFLDITADDIKDFRTIRHHFDNPFSPEEVTNFLSDYEINLKIQQEKYLHINKEKEFLEKNIEEIKQSKLFNTTIYPLEPSISFPYQSFFNIRHWRKAPKTLKIFFQALSCFFAITNNYFLIELKTKYNFIEKLQIYQPSSIVINEFRIKYSNLKEISPDYIRNKSFDAYNISIWLQNFIENDRLFRFQQSQIDDKKQLEHRLNQFHINLTNKQKELQSTLNIFYYDDFKRIILGFHEAISILPKEQINEFDLSKLYQQLSEAFYAYESYLTNFVFDRDMSNIIYSLGFIPSLHEMNQIILAMRYHPQSRTSEREEIDVDHHLIHISDFIDIILPKLVNKEYQPVDEQYLLLCFKKLDQNNKNYLHKNLFIQTMSTMEDALDEHESNDLLDFLTKNNSLTIENLQDFFSYKRYIKHLLPQRHLIYLGLDVKK